MYRIKTYLRIIYRLLMGKKVKTQENNITQYLWPAAAAGSETLWGSTSFRRAQDLNKPLKKA